MGIQSSINSMIGTATRSVFAVRALGAMKNGQNGMSQLNNAADTQPKGQQSVQAQAAQIARDSAASEIESKRQQKESFKDRLQRDPAAAIAEVIGGKNGSNK